MNQQDLLILQSMIKDHALPDIIDILLVFYRQKIDALVDENSKEEAKICAENYQLLKSVKEKLTPT